MRLPALCALVLLALPSPAWPQSQTVLAAGHLASVVTLPVYFRLYRAHLPVGQHSTYRGSNAMLYELSGAATLDFGDSRTQPLAEGAGVFIEPGQGVVITASASAPSELVLFVLSALPNQKPPLDKPAVTKELFRTGESLPGLEPGPHDFTLARVTFPAATPGGAATRAEAALDYVVAGSGEVTAAGKTEPVAAEAALVELADLPPSWANPGGEPLIVLRAAITPAK